MLRTISRQTRMEKIKVINRSSNQLPAYASADAVGLDLHANITEPITLRTLERAIVPTGLFTEIPSGFEIQIRPRSGLAAKHGVTVLNSPGTIDPDYRGEIKIILVNLSSEPFVINPRERIAQAVLAKYVRLEWELTAELVDTPRSDGGFGSTGK